MEAILVAQLDHQTTPLLDIASALTILSHRKSLADPRVEEAIYNYYDQVKEMAASMEDEQKAQDLINTRSVGLSTIYAKHPEVTADPRVIDDVLKYFNKLKKEVNIEDSKDFNSRSVDLARLNDPEVTEALLEYALSEIEQNRLYYERSLYENVFISIRNSKNKNYKYLLERLLPQLEGRGITESSIQYGMETLALVSERQQEDVMGDQTISNNRPANIGTSSVSEHRLPKDKQASTSSSSEDGESKIWYYLSFIGVLVCGFLLKMKFSKSV